jgi:hypothetical protein
MQRIIDVYNQHPKLTAWVVLAIGMVIILLWSARDVGLLPQQTLALVIATIGLAGLCVWIIGWEDEEAEGNEAEGNEAEGNEAEENEAEPAADSK